MTISQSGKIWINSLSTWDMCRAYVLRGPSCVNVLGHVMLPPGASVFHVCQLTHGRGPSNRQPLAACSSGRFGPLSFCSADVWVRQGQFHHKMLLAGYSLSREGYYLLVKQVDFVASVVKQRKLLLSTLVQPSHASPLLHACGLTFACVLQLLLECLIKIRHCAGTIALQPG